MRVSIYISLIYITWLIRAVFYFSEIVNSRTSLILPTSTQLYWKVKSNVNNKSILKYPQKKTGWLRRCEELGDPFQCGACLHAGHTAIGHLCGPPHVCPGKTEVFHDPRSERLGGSQRVLLPCTTSSRGQTEWTALRKFFFYFLSFMGWVRRVRANRQWYVAFTLRNNWIAHMRLFFRVLGRTLLFVLVFRF